MQLFVDKVAGGASKAINLFSEQCSAEDADAWLKMVVTDAASCCCQGNHLAECQKHAFIRPGDSRRHDKRRDVKATKWNVKLPQRVLVGTASVCMHREGQAGRRYLLTISLELC